MMEKSEPTLLPNSFISEDIISNNFFIYSLRTSSYPLLKTVSPQIDLSNQALLCITKIGKLSKETER